MRQAAAVAAAEQAELVRVGELGSPESKPPGRVKRWSTLGRLSPATHCPRERLLVAGSATLSEVELVSLLLGRGRPSAVTQATAERMLRAWGDLSRLAMTSPQELRFFGLDEAAAALVLAAAEVARRITAPEPAERMLLRVPREIVSFLACRYSSLDQEIFGVLLLDSSHRLLEVREIFRGTHCRAAVEPRQILRAAILAGASSLVLFHNHPSGDLTPSAEDFAFTRCMTDALDTLGLRLLDHLIVANPERWVSMRERRPW